MTKHFDYYSFLLQNLNFNKQDPTWDRFYDKNITHAEYKSPQNITQAGNIYINEVFFENFRPNGVINVTNPDNSDNKMLVSKSSFSNSYSSQDGGSIYVKEGSCIQYRICSINSTIPDEKGNGCHSSVWTSKENYIIETSLSKSKGSGSCICLGGGSQLIDSTNISHAECKLDAAYDCSYGPSSHLINFTSIFNNTADNGCVMYHDSNNQFIFHCNVINNTLKGDETDSNGIVFAYVNLLNISFCVFSSNSGNYLFCNLMSEFVVYQCYLYNKNIKETSLFEVSLATTNQLVLNLSHLSTKECEADFPFNNIQNQLKKSYPSKFMKTIFSLFSCSHSE